jgi:hypothetical protein
MGWLKGGSVERFTQPGKCLKLQGKVRLPAFSGRVLDPGAGQAVDGETAETGKAEFVPLGTGSRVVGQLHGDLGVPRPRAFSFGWGQRHYLNP